MAPRFGGLEQSYSGVGSLVTLWSACSNAKLNTIVINSDSNRLVKVEQEGIRYIRWISNNKLLATKTAHDGTTLIEFDRSENVLKTDRKDFNFGDVAISKSSEYAVLLSVNSKGNAAIEIREMNDAFGLISSFSGSGFESVSSPIWDAEGERVAFAYWKNDIKHRSWPVLAYSSIDLRDINYPIGNTVEQQGEPAGFTPLFWNKDGIYGRSDRGLIKASLKSDKINLVYSPGEKYKVAGGVMYGGHSALLLIRDLSRGEGQFEARSREIHEVDLRNGSSRVFARAAGNDCILSIDWIGE